LLLLLLLLLFVFAIGLALGFEFYWLLGYWLIYCTYVVLCMQVYVYLSFFYAPAIALDPNACATIKLTN